MRIFFLIFGGFYAGRHSFREAFSGIEAQSLGPLFLQCFDTVGWVF